MMYSRFCLRVLAGSTLSLTLVYIFIANHMEYKRLKDLSMKRYSLPRIKSDLKPILFELKNKKMIEGHVPVTAIPPSQWIKYNNSWEGMSMPIISAVALGGLGNVMGEYATLFAISKIYNTSAVLSTSMQSALVHYFHNLSIPKSPGHTNKSFKLVGELKPKYNFTTYEQAAAGIFGPGLFMFTGCSFEMQLFNVYREEIRKEFTFSAHVVDKANQFLRDQVIQRNIEPLDAPFVFISVHIRLGDYIKHLWDNFKGVLDTLPYIKKSTEYYRQKFRKVIFVFASVDVKFLKSNFGNISDIIISEGRNAIEELALLTRCNHSIITVGSFGFWSAYLGHGDVIYADVKTERDYRFSRKRFQDAHLTRFFPMTG